MVGAINYLASQSYIIPEVVKYLHFINLMTMIIKRDLRNAEKNITGKFIMKKNSEYLTQSEIANGLDTKIPGKFYC